MPLLAINSTNVKEPSGVGYTISEISEGGRNANAEMLLQSIAVKTRLDVSWNYLTASEYTTLYSLVGNTPSNNPYFTVTYLDPRTNTNRTSTFYLAGDRKLDMYMFQNNTAYYRDVELSFIEK